MTDMLYTVVCEFHGGTYVAQVRANDEIQAVRHWADLVRTDRPIPRVSAHLARNAVRDLESHGLTPLDGLQGVWCFTAIVGQDVALGNLILSS